MNDKINYSSIYKYLLQCSHKEYYDLIPILSHRTPINIIIGTRNTGKSTAVAILCVLDYVVNGKKFMYLRRREKEVPVSAKDFINGAVDIINTYTDLSIQKTKYEKGKYYIGKITDVTDDGEEVIEWEEIGMSYALKNEEQLKPASVGGAFSEYRTIVYDEFISKDRNAYLGVQSDYGAEWRALSSLYQTIDRGINNPTRDETSIFLMANMSSRNNPIFLSLDVIDYYDTSSKIISPKKGRWAFTWTMQNIKSVPATEHIKQSIAYRISDAETARYAYESETREDDKDFIARAPKCSYYGTLIIKDIHYGIYHDGEKTYIDNGVKNPTDREKFPIYVLDHKSFKESTGDLIIKWRANPLMTWLKTEYEHGRLFFKDIKTRTIFLQYLDLMV